MPTRNLSTALKTDALEVATVAAGTKVAVAVTREEIVEGMAMEATSGTLQTLSMD
ncbi:hypothetical protein EV192_104204 [Actinocrispum wychmicini]|uniref:Uncharacterized protein n=1 Tax=Actinocrispum wychmicini TaxID=1213861 RepID=A0A4R2JHM3_9PSEU|nr:hypothetical protein EV192_104204 [Actinocrispum wychmicini]